MSISNLVEDNWWWRPDFLSFLQGLMETAKEEVKLSLEEMERRLRVPLTEEIGERDHELGQLKKPGAILRIEEIWTPRLLRMAIKPTHSAIQTTDKPTNHTIRRTTIPKERKNY